MRTDRRRAVAGNSVCAVAYVVLKHFGQTFKRNPVVVRLTVYKRVLERACIIPLNVVEVNDLFFNSPGYRSTVRAYVVFPRIVGVGKRERYGKRTCVNATTSFNGNSRPLDEKCQVVAHTVFAVISYKRLVNEMFVAVVVNGCVRVFIGFRPYKVNGIYYPDYRIVARNTRTAVVPSYGVAVFVLNSKVEPVITYLRTRAAGNFYVIAVLRN